MDRADAQVWQYLRHHWDGAYEFRCNDTPGVIRPFGVKRRDGEGEIWAETPDALDRLIAEDYRRKPVPREVAP